MEINRYIKTLFYAFVYIVIAVLKVIYYCTENLNHHFELRYNWGQWGG